MRMWMVDPSLMCRQHLLGEHGELHKFMPSWQKRHSIAGRVAINSIEPLAYQARHEALAAEMLRRGFNHKSPIMQPDFSYLPEQHLHAHVDPAAAYELLISKCPACRSMT